MTIDMIIFLVGKDSCRATTNSIKGIESNLSKDNGIYLSYLNEKMHLRNEIGFDRIVLIRAGIV